MCIRRYFIIVDDIWSTPAWELVKSALPENNLNSRIITTTRIVSVAESCCSSLTGHVYKIQPLSHQQSQQLFFKRVFRDSSPCPPHLEEISHRILEKCHGLPLAIVTIASMLAGKLDKKDQWEYVCNSINSAFSHQGMREILLLSYYDLPHHLKTCFLYLSMFPEDDEIYWKELVLRWIAEGFIPEVRGESVDQVAENYFNELINRSLIQPVDIQYDGRARACRVHDMVLDLIVSLSKDGNFASIVEDQSYKVGGHTTIRRLSVQSEHVGDKVIQEIMDKWSHVRSISFYGLQKQEILRLEGLYSLRVLAFYYCSHLGNQHLKYIGSFFRLTFLRIGCSKVTELPEGIGDLRYLQTLDIEGSGIRKLPPSIGRLQKLVRLLVSNVVELPDEVGDLQALQELPSTYFFHSIKFVESLRRLTKLKELGIDIPYRERLGCDTERYEEAFKSSLAAIGKHGLQSLNISKSDILEDLMDILCCSAPYLRELHVMGSGNTHLSNQMASLVNLSYLSLYIKRIKQEDLCILGAIPALLSANLLVAHAPDERLTIRSQQFRCLKEFIFSSNHAAGGGLEMLFLQEAMPELRRLTLYLDFRVFDLGPDSRVKETESKMGFEFSFEHLASLEHIDITIWRNNATRSREDAAEAAIRNAVSIHPGRPTLVLKVEEDKNGGEDRSGHGMDEVLAEHP
jgi:hypothetical protein